MISIEHMPQTDETKLSCKRQLVDIMAETMREMACSGQTVDVAALEQRGFTSGSIAKLSGEAVAVARRRSVKQVAAV